MNKQKSFLKKLTGSGIVVFSLAATVLILLLVIIYGGAPRKKAAMEKNLGIIDRFYMGSANAISDAAADIAQLEKKYWISGDAQAAPKADADGFGATTDPALMSDVIKKAEKLLSGQKMYFSPDIEIVEGSEIRYYLDETIFVITWKQAINYSVYTFSEVKIADPSQLRRYLSGGEYGSGKLAIPTELANNVNAIVASSGDYYAFRNAGVIVYEGEVCRVSPGADTCYIDSDGNMHFTLATEKITEESAKQFVKDNRISFSVAFGPVLVRNGEKCRFSGYNLGEIGSSFARAALCQMDDLHYLLMNANAEGKHSSYQTMYQFADVVYETGCRDAYALDGGQTAVIVMDGELMNQVTRGYQRKISDIIYFATALPDSKG